MSKSKIAPGLDASWKIEVDTQKEIVDVQSQSLIHPLLSRSLLWIRCDGAFATTHRKSIRYGSQMAWTIPCSDATTPEREAAADHDEWLQIGQIAYNAMPSVASLSLCAAVELACYESSTTMLEEATLEEASQERSLERLRIHWPLDAETPSHMMLKIDALRALTGKEKPIGVAIPVINLSDEFFESIRWLLDCRVDWIHWLLPAACIGCDHEALDYLLDDPFIALDSIQKWQKGSMQSASSLPAIVIEYPWENGYQAAEMIRRGASAVVLPDCSKIIQVSNQEAPSAFIRSESFPHGSLGATISYAPTSFLQSAPPLTPQAFSKAIQTKDLGMDRLYVQFKTFLDWSES